MFKYDNSLNYMDYFSPAAMNGLEKSTTDCRSVLILKGAIGISASWKAMTQQFDSFRSIDINPGMDNARFWCAL